VTQTWDAVALLVLAAQAADSYEGDAIKEHLQTVANAPGIEVTSVCAGLKLLSSGQDIDYQGVSGNVDLDENGDVIGNYDVWAVDEQGKVEVINQIKLDR
jgi:neutral amino acid transport system substrate-binding protein